MEKLKGGPKGISFEPPDLIAKKTLEILQNPFFKSWEIKIREFDVNCDYGNSCIAYSKLRLYSNIDTEQLTLNILNIAFYNHNVVFSYDVNLLFENNIVLFKTDRKSLEYFDLKREEEKLYFCDNHLFFFTF